MSNHYKLTFTLKQHTPLIHFQHNQPGATLRATELKPKLDRFLLERYPSLPHRTHPNGDRSLDYRVTIEAKGVDFEEIPDRHPLFFGNMGEGKKKKFSLADEINITFQSFQSEILKSIKKSFTAFLAVTNFGTRQSKGFGSFYLKDESFNPSLIDSNRYTRIYRFDCNQKEYQTDINTLYKFLRTGINDFNFRTQTSSFYTKPAIFHYAQQQGWIWDKRAIKEQLLHVADPTDPNRYRLVRDLFGLSTEQLWLSYDKTKILKSHPTIDRFKSPIFFKPIETAKGKMNIYFFADKTVGNPMLNQTFTVRATRQHERMTLPTPNRFDWEEFFDFAFDLDLQQIIDQQYRRAHTYHTLKRIISQLRSGR